MRSPTTKIHVLEEIWHVPRGFGAAYRRVLRDHLARQTAGEPDELISAAIDLLALIGYHATVEQVTGWNLRKRVEAIVYAGLEYARASDNPVPRHPRPDWLPMQPWKGAPHDGSALTGPCGTLIVERS